ncbi:MAG: hypothetical protein U5K27_00260 [Desulfotignum sp.]|nr:hypothetical protein [Desulfotignum sp.]
MRTQTAARRILSAGAADPTESSNRPGGVGGISDQTGGSINQASHCLPSSEIKTMQATIDIETAGSELAAEGARSAANKEEYEKCVLTIVGILFLVLPGTAWGEDFRQWLEDFYPQVANEGISRATWETAFDGIDQPDARVLEKACFQLNLL